MDQPIELVAIIGSLRADSFNRSIFRTAQDLVGDGVTLTEVSLPGGRRCRCRDTRRPRSSRSARSPRNVHRVQHENVLRKQPRHPNRSRSNTDGEVSDPAVREQLKAWIVGFVEFVAAQR
jgi:hypothetical protein